VVAPFTLISLPLKPGLEWYLGAGIFLGYEMGKYITCDWDIMGTSKDEGRIVNEIPILGHFIFGISSTYGSIFRRHHRSFITHFPFVSTSIRYLFLFWWVWWQIYLSTWDLAWLVFLFAGAFIGTSLSDGIHWAADMSGKWKDS
jgi:hypothetical protein